MHVAVIGAGIVGASIAYHLARRGADVTVLDRALAGGGATAKSFSWINAHETQSRAYFDLRMASIEAYHTLAQDLGDDMGLRWGGSLAWENDDDDLAALADRLGVFGYPARIIDAEAFSELEPQVADAPARAVHSECEGALNPVAATDALMRAAARHGARHFLGCEVLGVETSGTRITGVKTGFGVVAADHVVVAAGIEAADVLATAGLNLPMDNRGGLVVHTAPVAPVLDHLILAPEIHFRQEADGRILVVEDFTGLIAGDDPVALAADLLKRLKQRLPRIEGLEIGTVMLGMRPVPLDGYPAVGHMRGVDGLYLASMHSGITLAPIIGELAAGEILDGEPAGLLEPFRPTRFNR